MLTIRKIQVAPDDRRGAMAAARYPLEQGDAPQAFLRGDSDGSREVAANAVWLGSEEALSRLGLERGATVSAPELASALQGRHVDERDKQVRRPGTVKVRDDDGNPILDDDGEPLKKPVVNSYDLTFSVPKSVSILWSQADAELREEIERATMTAASAALEHVTGTRPVISGKSSALGFAASMALHVTARTASDEEVPSPQLHVHGHLVGVLANDGGLRTPDSGALYKDNAMREGGAFGRAVLAREMRRLGFGIEARTGRGGRYFEIVGVPEALREQMSGRSRDILAWARQREAELGGTLSNRDRAAGAVATRQAKSELSAAAIQRFWDAQGRKLGLDANAVKALRSNAALEPDPEQAEVLAKVREAVLEQTWAAGPTLSLSTLRSFVYEAAPLGVGPVEAGAVLEWLQAEGELIALDGGRVTSREIREAEERVHRIATTAAVKVSRPLSETAIAAGVAAAERDIGGAKLDPEQRDAVTKLSSGAGWANLTGRAGTGKGPVLQAVAEAHRAEGWQVIAAAVDGATTQRLGHQVGAPGMTIEQLLYRLREGKLPVGNRTLILLEEASKIGLRHWDAMAQLVEQSGARLIPIGDVQQVGAIESPGMLDALLGEARIPKAELLTVRRHQDPRDRDLGPGDRRSHPWLAKYLGEIYEGDMGTAIKILRQEGAIQMHGSREEAMLGLVDTWERRRQDHEIEAKDAVLVVHGSNEDIDQVNALAQDRRLRARQLSGPGLKAVDREYSLYAGDVVMMRESAYQPGVGDGRGGRPERVENGTTGIVVGVDLDGDAVEIEFEQPGGRTRRVRVDLGELRREHLENSSSERRPASLRLAYAGHPFPLQGGTWEYVGSLWGDPSQNKEATYSGDSRPRFWLDVHVDRESTGSRDTDELDEDVDHQIFRDPDDARYARLAKRLGQPTHRQASIAFGKSTAKISAPDREPDAIPELPRVRVEVAASPAVEPRLVTDPLEPYMRLFGPARLGRLRELLTEAAERSALGREELERERDDGDAAMDALDRPAALRTRRIEDERRLLAVQVKAARDTAARLREEAKQLDGLRTRREQAEVLQQAAAEETTASGDERKLSGLIDEELKLRRSKHHPDDWVRDHGPRFARGIIAEQRLGPELDQPAPEREHGTEPEIPATPDMDGPELDF